MELELLAIVEIFKELKGTFLGQDIMVSIDHKNLEEESLGTLSDRVYQWALLLEEFPPRIEYIKGTNNLLADAISSLRYTPSKCISSHFHFIKLSTLKYDPDVKCHVKWKAFSCLYYSCDNSADTIDVGKNIEKQKAGFTSCFASSWKEEQEEIYPPKITEIFDAQCQDKNLSRYFKREGTSSTKTKRYKISLVKDTEVVTDNGK